MIKTRYFDPTFILLFVLIIWDALKVYLNLSAPATQLAILLPLFLIAVLDSFNSQFLKIVFSRPVVIWLIWIIYASINTFLINDFTPHRDINPFVLTSAMIISLSFLVFIVNKQTSMDRLINVLLWAYFTRLLISLVFDRIAIKGHDFVARFGIDFNSNLVGFGALFIIILLLIKKIYSNKIEKIYYLFAGLSIYTIIISASKKTFIALIISLIFYIFISREKMLFKNIVKYTVSTFIISVCILWVLNNTSLGLRLTDSYDRTQHANKVEAMFDNRLAQYIYGWEVFKEHPINGVGLSNFVNVSGFSTPLHTEYMVQIAECGLIGFTLFIFFYSYIIKWLILIRRELPSFKSHAEIHLLSILVMFILFSGSWIYNNPMMWCLIALAVRFIKDVQEQRFDLHMADVSRQVNYK